MNNNKKKALAYLSFEDLAKQTKYDFKNVNFNNSQVCNTLLKLYDKGQSLNSTGDEENAYLLLMKFFEAYVALRASKLYKEDKNFVENMITSDKLNKTIANLESLKESLLFRYEEAEKNRQLLKDAESVVKKSVSKPLIINIQQIITKNFIKPIEFTELMTKSDFKFLIIDTRTTNEYSYSHMNLSILLPDLKKHSFINIPGDLVENVAWKLEEAIKKQDNDSVFKIFSNRKDYDYLILIDKDSSAASFKPESKLCILKRALFDFELNDKLKNEPLILDGGWNEWINIYPGYSSSSSNIIQKESVKPLNDDKNVFSNLKKSFDFDYPEFKDLPKPTQQVAQTVIQTPDQIKIIQENNSPVNESVNKTIATIKEEIKPPPVAVASASKFVQKPIINRSIKPVAEPDVKLEKKPQIMNDFSSDEETDEEELKKDSEIFKLNSQIAKPTIQQQQLPQSPPSNQSTVMLSNNQSITNIKFVPPSQPQPQPPPPQLVPPNVDDNIKNEKSIFEAVYKPTRFKLIKMNSGASKILDQNTGLFKISNQPAPKPNIVQIGDNKAKLQNESTNQMRKDETEFKSVPKTNDLNRKLTLKRTLSIPNIANMDDDINTNNNNSNNKPNDENFPKSKPVDPQDIDKAKQSILNAKVFPPKPLIISKPAVNREVKPMNEITNINRSRIPELQPIYGDVPPGLTGIKNLGNTCFMNSIIQCLNSTNTLVDYFLNGQFRKDLNRTNELGFKGEIADEFSVIVSASWSGHCKTIAPRRFKNILGQFNQQFVSNEQQDAQELLLFLLDGLHEDLNKIKKRPKISDKDDDNDNLSDSEAANQAWNIHLSINNSIIVDLFQGQFKSTVTCSYCQKQSVKFDAFMYLTLPILANKCNLNQCLELFLKPENMTGESKWKCPRCKQYRDAVKKIDIWKLPPILIVHLKRFKYHGLWRDKITTNVDYPIENLNLDKYVLNNENKRTGAQNYYLYGISNHSGTLDGGHYIAHCRHKPTNRWFKYDDTDVKEVVDMANLKSPTSYILFYSRL